MLLLSGLSCEINFLWLYGFIPGLFSLVSVAESELFSVPSPSSGCREQLIPSLVQIRQ